MSAFRIPSVLTRPFSVAALSVGLAIALGSPCARAQAVVTAVNGSPITSFDVDEYTKLLKLLRKPATRPAALEELIADHLKYDEGRHWGVDASESDLSATLAKIAGRLKLEPQALIEAATKIHVDPDAFRAHIRSQAVWDGFVRARNKTLEVSAEEVTARLASQQKSLRITDYTVRQIVFVLPGTATPALVETRVKEAQALRNRFAGCDTGLQLARGLPDVAVKESTTRTSDSITPALRKLLDDTPKGRLTVPQRSAAGIEMIAICEKNDANDQTTLRDRVEKDLLTDKLADVSEKMYKDLRATAVISKN